MLYFQNAVLYTSRHALQPGTLLVGRDRIIAIGDQESIAVPPGAQVIDAQGLIITPGFIDLQVNGAFGHDFTLNPESIWQVAAELPRFGVTGFLPTIITSPLTTIQWALGIMRQEPPQHFHGALPLGLHLEGPFLNPAKKGAHNPAYLRSPRLSDIEGWSAASGVRIVTLAPELPGALDLIRTLVSRGVVVSTGHSMATFEEAQAAFNAGATWGTHLFNAMPPLDHRRPGLAAALLDQSNIRVGMIVDGIHVHPAMVKLAWASLGEERLCLVTDAMAAMGMAPGNYKLAEFTVLVDDHSARLADGTLAGSILTQNCALQKLIQFSGCSLDQALACVTSTPARTLGLTNKGELRSGMDADLVLMTPAGEIKATYVAGELAYSNISLSMEH